MNPGEFITKWRPPVLKERSAVQERLIDLCRLLDESIPAEADPAGDHNCFEPGVVTDTGGDGWADVWKRGCFAWEYKGKHANLDAAFNQLRRYALALENPRLRIVTEGCGFIARHHVHPDAGASPTASGATSRTIPADRRDWVNCNIIPL